METGNGTIDYDYNITDYEGELIVQCIMENTSIITGVCFIAIFCFSTLGNAMLFYALCRFEDLRRVTMLFLLFLAVFDLLFTLTLPFWAVDHLYQWVFGDAACQILTGAYFVGIYGSLMLLTAMTVDRLFAIVIRSPRYTPRTRLNCARAAFAGSLIISIAGSLKDALSSSIVKDEYNISTCNTIQYQDDTKEGYYVQLVMLFIIPLIIIILCYGKILHTLMFTSGRWRYRSVLVVLAIVVAFIICWGPYHVLIIVMDKYRADKAGSCQETIQATRAFVACQILAYFHCCVNPLLFLLRGRSRKILFSFLLCSPEVRNSAHHEDLSDPSHFHMFHRASEAYQQPVTEFRLV